MSADNWGECPKCGGEDTLKEYYQIGIYKGEFFIDFVGTCEDCGFEFKHSHTESVL